MPTKPRNVRNFWIEAEIDGPRGVQKISGGPAAVTGAFKLTVYQRDEGRILSVLTMEGFSQENGDELILTVRDDTPSNRRMSRAYWVRQGDHLINGRTVLQCVTKRNAEVR